MKSIPFARRHLPAILWLAALFGQSSIPGYKLPEVHLFSFDKLVHLAIYGVLGVLLVRSLEAQKRWPKLSAHPFIWAAVLASLYGITDELHQLFTPNRSADVFDWLADTLGAVLFILALRWLRRQTRPTRSPIA